MSIGSTRAFWWSAATISDPDSGMFSRADQVDAPVEQA